jgi:hypothetical protein
MTHRALRNVWGKSRPIPIGAMGARNRNGLGMFLWTGGMHIRFRKIKIFLMADENPPRRARALRLILGPVAHLLLSHCGIMDYDPASFSDEVSALPGAVENHYE